jgi:hypothetical protein
MFCFQNINKGDGKNSNIYRYDGRSHFHCIAFGIRKCFDVEATGHGELLELRLLDTQLLDTFGSKSIARHKKRNCSNRLNRFFEQFHFLRADEQLLDSHLLDTFGRKIATARHNL